MVNSHKLLMAMGLQPPSVEKKGPPKRVLTDAEMRASQDLIIMMRKDIMSRGIRPEQVIEKHKKAPSDLTMSPQSFRNVLLAEFA